MKYRIILNNSVLLIYDVYNVYFTSYKGSFYMQE